MVCDESQATTSTPSDVCVTMYVFMPLEVIASDLLSLHQLYAGDVPFHELSDMRAMMHIVNGKRPERPASQNGFGQVHPSNLIWDLITRCWNHSPESRPAMPKIVSELKAELGDPDYYLYYNHTDYRSRCTLELKLAIETQDLAKVWKLVKRADVRVNAQGQLLIYQRYDNYRIENSGAFPSALQLAAFEGDLPLVQVLLGEGADIDIQGNNDDLSRVWVLMSGYRRRVWPSHCGSRSPQKRQCRCVSFDMWSKYPMD
jgi:hypothetical protein